MNDESSLVGLLIGAGIGFTIATALLGLLLFSEEIFRFIRRFFNLKDL